MTDRLRWGIVGTGNIAGQFAKGVAGSQRSEVVAVGSRSLGSAETFAEQHEVPTPHGSYDELLANPAVEAVYISLPNSMHHDWTLRAIEAGKHVLCEKPFAVTFAEGEAMFEAAKDKGVVLIEAFMYRCHPLIQAVVDTVRAGQIGRVQMIRTSFVYHTNKIDGNVRFDRTLAGGGLMDIGCYCIDFARLITGMDPIAVHATGRIHETGVDDLAAGTMTFPEGVLASFVCGMSAQTDNAALICGDAGYIRVPIPWKPPVESAEYEVRTMTPPRQDKRGGGPTHETRTVDANMPLYGLEADAFAAAVRDGAAPFMPEADTMSNLATLDEMRSQIGLGF